MVPDGVELVAQERWYRCCRSDRGDESGQEPRAAGGNYRRDGGVNVFILLRKLEKSSSRQGMKFFVLEIETAADRGNSCCEWKLLVGNG